MKVLEVDRLSWEWAEEGACTNSSKKRIVRRIEIVPGALGHVKPTHLPRLKMLSEAFGADVWLRQLHVEQVHQQRDRTCIPTLTKISV